MEVRVLEMKFLLQSYEKRNHLDKILGPHSAGSKLNLESLLSTASEVGK